ncbi:MAG TPA: type II CAAX endopeptidase family protein [Candidatus Acidoferrum sp.]|nr:type II CAAX endopeptidase family protein [Candidatus Acidoferrum sp.]
MSERFFLGADGRVRPIFRALVFAMALFVVDLEISRAVYGFTQRSSFWAQLFWSSLALTTGFLLLSWLFVWLADGKRISSLGLAFARGWGRELALGFGIGLALQILILVSFLATRSVHYSGGVALNLQFWRRVAMNVALFLLAATVEELAFRGYAFQKLIESFGAAGALVVTSIIFGGLHFFNPNATIFSTINTILAGIILAIPYIRTRSMWMQVGLHWAWNLAMATLVSLPVSGINFEPHVFSAQTTGPAWLTGGTYGPEGGAVVTVVSVAAIAWLLRTRQLFSSHAPPEVLQ